MQQLTKEALRDEDFGMILETLCLDGKVERLRGEAVDGSDDRFKKPAIAPLRTTALTSMPCGVCPVRAQAVGNSNDVAGHHWDTIVFL